MTALLSHTYSQHHGSGSWSEYIQAMPKLAHRIIAHWSDREIQEQQLDELRLIRRKTSIISGILIFSLVCSFLLAFYILTQLDG